MNRTITSSDVRYAFPPGDIIYDELQSREKSKSDLAHALGIGGADVEALFAGTLPLTEELAQRLEAFFGPPADFWLNLERNFRDGLWQGKQKGSVHSEDIVRTAAIGKVSLRLPITLHAKLKQAAEEEGVSINMMLVSIIAETIGRRQVTNSK